MREKPNVVEDDLLACLHERYGITTVTLDFLPLGADYDAGVYRVRGEDGNSYLLKIKSGPLYEPGYLVSRYLREQGIASVVTPIPTKSNALWTQVGTWTTLVFPFIEGDTSWTGMTAQQWQETGRTLKQIHQVVLPAKGFEGVRKETFDPSEYARWLRAFDAQHAHTEGKNAAERLILSAWITYRDTIHTAVASLEKLAEALQQRSGPYVICHADLHASNLLRTQDGCVFVIDWDDVKLAPRERDFIYAREQRANGPSWDNTTPFFQGYGETEIDWTALTYYLWERVAQDLIAYAESALFEDKWSEETRIESARIFHSILAGEGEEAVTAALAAAAHLPPEFAIHGDKSPDERR